MSRATRKNSGIGSTDISSTTNSAATTKANQYAAVMAGFDAETAPGVTKGAMATLATVSQCSIGTVTFTASGAVITTSVAHGLAVGERIAFTGVTGINVIGSNLAFYVRAVPTSTTLEVAYNPGGAKLTWTGDGTATGVQRHQYGWDTQAGVINPIFRWTDARPAQAGLTDPLWNYVVPDPTIVTYAPGSLTGPSLRVAFEFTGTKLDILARQNGLTIEGLIRVDGRPAGSWGASDFAGASITGGNIGRIPLTFPDARTRRIELVAVGQKFVGVQHGAGAISYPYSAPPKGAQWQIVGDSFTEGTGATSRSLVRVLADDLGWVDVWQCGSGSTGYAANGARTALGSRYVNDIVNQTATGVVIAMGINDAASYVSSPSTVTSTAATVWDAVLATARIKSLVIVGPWPNGGGTGTIQPELVAMDTALAALAKARGLKYISPIQDGVTFTRADTTHPDQAGHEKLGHYLAARLA